MYSNKEFMRRHLLDVCKYFIYIYLEPCIGYVLCVRVSCVLLLLCVMCVWCSSCLCVLMCVLQVKLIHKRQISKSKSAEILTYTTSVTFEGFDAAESMLFTAFPILTLHIKLISQAMQSVSSPI